MKYEQDSGDWECRCSAATVIARIFVSLKLQNTAVEPAETGLCAVWRRRDHRGYRAHQHVPRLDINGLCSRRHAARIRVLNLHMR